MNFQITLELTIESIVSKFRIGLPDVSPTPSPDQQDDDEKHRLYDRTLEKMVVALQAARLRVKESGWSGFGKVEVMLGTFTVYIQISFSKSSVSLETRAKKKYAVALSSTPPDKNERKQEQTADTTTPWTFGKKGEGKGGENKDIILGSKRDWMKYKTITEFVDDDENEGENFGERLHECLSGLRKIDERTEFSTNKKLVFQGDGDDTAQTTKREKAEEEAKDAEKKKNEEIKERKEVESQKGMLFSKGLDKGIDRIERMSVIHIKGYQGRTSVMAAFNFTVFGFGVNTLLQVEITSITVKG